MRRTRLQMFQNQATWHAAVFVAPVNPESSREHQKSPESSRGAPGSRRELQRASAGRREPPRTPESHQRAPEIIRDQSFGRTIPQMFPTAWADKAPDVPKTNGRHPSHPSTCFEACSKIRICWKTNTGFTTETERKFIQRHHASAR